MVNFQSAPTGCDLRLFECLNLLVHNFNFDAGILMIPDGKGIKDRTVDKIDSPLYVGMRSFGHMSRVTLVGRVDTVTNGRFQVSEFNDSFPAINLKSGLSPGDPKQTFLHVGEA